MVQSLISMISRTEQLYFLLGWKWMRLTNFFIWFGDTKSRIFFTEVGSTCHSFVWLLSLPIWTITNFSSVHDLVWVSASILPAIIDISSSYTFMAGPMTPSQPRALDNHLHTSFLHQAAPQHACHAVPLRMTMSTQKGIWTYIIFIEYSKLMSLTSYQTPWKMSPWV